MFLHEVWLRDTGLPQFHRGRPGCSSGVMSHGLRPVWPMAEYLSSCRLKQVMMRDVEGFVLQPRVSASSAEHGAWRVAHVVPAKRSPCPTMYTRTDVEAPGAELTCRRPTPASLIQARCPAGRKT